MKRWFGFPNPTACLSARPVFDRCHLRLLAVNKKSFDNAAKSILDSEDKPWR